LHTVKKAQTRSLFLVLFDDEKLMLKMSIIYTITQTDFKTKCQNCIYGEKGAVIEALHSFGFEVTIL